jgi:hypothetical protein
VRIRPILESILRLVVTIDQVLVLTLIALAFFLVAVGAAVVHAGIRALEAFRAFGASASALDERLTIVADGADEAARRAAGLKEGSTRLQAALASFGDSRAELGLLLRELGRVREALDGVTGAVYGRR